MKTFFALVGIIFALVALAHAVRIYMEWPVIIGNWSVPKSVSWIAFMVTSGLALFAFRFAADSRACRTCYLAPKICSALLQPLLALSGQVERLLFVRFWG